jgi:drug/metabolite transporter (DMT)-like permease
MQAMIPLFFADAALWISVPLVESPFTLPSLPITWVAVAWLGLIGSCVAYLLYFYLVHNVGPTSATQVTYTFPVIGVILGVVFLNEKIDLYLALGAALVIVSLLVVNRKPKQKVEA